MDVNLHKIAYRLAKVRDIHGKFNISYFKSLNDPGKINTYLEESLEEIGRSTRAVFTLTSSKVVKVATNDKDLPIGISQNESEVNFYTNPLTKLVSTKILEYHPSFYWIISELVKPISDSEFEKFSGGTLSDIDYVVFRMEDESLSAQDILKLKKESSEGFPHDDFIKLLGDLKESGMKLNDLALSSSWGRTSSGKVVLLDYGLTPELMKNIEKRRKG